MIYTSLVPPKVEVYLRLWLDAITSIYKYLKKPLIYLLLIVTSLLFMSLADH